MISVAPKIGEIVNHDVEIQGEHRGVIALQPGNEIKFVTTAPNDDQLW